MKKVFDKLNGIAYFFLRNRNTTMKNTELNPEIAAELTQEIEFAGISKYADFMGLESAYSSDILEMTAAELMDAAQITDKQAEALMIALSVSDSPSLFGAYKVLNAVTDHQ